MAIAPRSRTRALYLLLFLLLFALNVFVVYSRSSAYAQAGRRCRAAGGGKLSR